MRGGARTRWRRDIGSRKTCGKTTRGANLRRPLSFPYTTPHHLSAQNLPKWNYNWLIRFDPLQIVLICIYSYIHTYIHTHIYISVMNSCIHPPSIISFILCLGSICPISESQVQCFPFPHTGESIPRRVEMWQKKWKSKCATCLSPILLPLPKKMRSQKHARARALAYNSITTIPNKLNLLPRASCQPPSFQTKKKKTLPHML